MRSAIVLILAACGAPPHPTPAQTSTSKATSTSPATATPTPAPTVEPPPPPPPAPCPAEPDRDRRQRPDDVIALVGIREGMTVVDLGSGSGYFLCRLSRAVGPSGHVIATEIDKAELQKLTKRVAAEQLANVEVVKAPANDVGIPAGTADRILVVNVWHHLPGRAKYAGRIGKALAPDGKLIVIDFPKASAKSEHGIASGRVLTELAAGGIDAALVSEHFSDQYAIVGTVRPAAPATPP